MGVFDVAIIGMDCRFPGANNIKEYWSLLKNGLETIKQLDNEDLCRANINKDIVGKENYVKAASSIDMVDLFDASFFGYSPKEASYIDPQQRIFLELAWTCLEEAGYNSEQYDGSIGVFAGEGFNSYLINNLVNRNIDQTSVDKFLIQISNDKDSLATRVSYKLNLRGPSVSLQTACSTSLVAVHFACQSLLDFECDMALAGGVRVSVPQNMGYVYQDGMILSKDGHCRPFDTQAGGTVFGNGAGIVLLKRLEDAIKDKDQIICVIKSSAINNDGAAKVGYTAPSVEGQRNVINKALLMADIPKNSISAIEAHGTGTSLGDSIELQALSEVFSAEWKNGRRCALGSVKGNIGHLETASGIASLIKMALCLKNKELVPSINFNKPNPHLDLESSPFYVNTLLKKWKPLGNNNVLRCGISSFGIGGTNAHVIMEQPLSRECVERKFSTQLLVISAKTEAALNSYSKKLLQYLKEDKLGKLLDIAFTLQVGRKMFKYRQSIVCDNKIEAIRILENSSKKDIYEVKNNQLKIAIFLSTPRFELNDIFQLYEEKMTFRKTFDYCMNFFEENKIYKDKADFQYYLMKSVPLSVLQFSIEYAMIRLWITWGVEPQIILGAGIGEFVAACVSGVLSIKEALNIILQKTNGSDKSIIQSKATEFSLERYFSVSKMCWIHKGEALRSDYWRDVNGFSNLKLMDAISCVSKEGINNFLDLGSDLQIEQCLNCKEDILLDSIYNKEKPLMRNIMECLSELWIRGYKIDWKYFHEGEMCYRISLPTYTFERKKCWIGEDENSVNDKYLNQEEIKNKKFEKDNSAWGEKDILVYVKTVVKDLLEFSNDDIIDPKQHLIEYGMDSVLAIELREILMKKFQINLNPNTFFLGFSIEKIIKQIISEMNLKQ